MSTIHTAEQPQRRGYPTDLTDAQWAWVAPLLEAHYPAAHPNRKHTLREVLNAMFYRLRTGCQWRNLPADFPPYSTVSDYFHQWRKKGLIAHLHAAVRRQTRQQAGKDPLPSAGSLDSQTAKSTEKGGPKARLG